MLESRKTLPTWRQRSRFQYSGSAATGTNLHYGTAFRYCYRVSSNVYDNLLRRFSNQEVSIGTSRTDPPKGSLGEWLALEHNIHGLSCYIGPILVEEGYAARAPQPDRILIKDGQRPPR